MPRYDAKPNTIARKSTPIRFTDQDVRSIVRLTLFAWGALFFLFAALWTTWDQWDKSRGMTLIGLIKASVSCSGLALVGALVLAALILWWRSRRKPASAGNEISLARAMFFEIEEVVNVDLNRDGVVGTHLAIQTGPREMMLGEYNAPPELLLEWARTATNPNGRLSYSRWEKEWPEGREGYARFRDKLIEQGRLKRNKGGKVSLTDKGRAFWGKLLYLDERQLGTPQIAPPHQRGYPELPPHTGTHDSP